MSQRVQVEETATKEGLERERGWTESPYKRRQTHTRSHCVHDTDPDNTFLEYHSLKVRIFENYHPLQNDTKMAVRVFLI